MSKPDYISACRGHGQAFAQPWLVEVVLDFAKAAGRARMRRVTDPMNHQFEIENRKAGPLTSEKWIHPC